MMVSNGFHNLPFGHNQLMTGTSTFCEIKLKKPYNVLDEIKRIQEDQALWFKLGEWIMEQKVIFECREMQLQTAVLYRYA